MKEKGKKIKPEISVAEMSAAYRAMIQEKSRALYKKLLDFKLVLVAHKKLHAMQDAEFKGYVAKVVDVQTAIHRLSGFTGDGLVQSCTENDLRQLCLPRTSLSRR